MTKANKTQIKALNLRLAAQQKELKEIEESTNPGRELMARCVIQSLLDTRRQLDAATRAA